MFNVPCLHNECNNKQDLIRQVASTKHNKTATSTAGCANFVHESHNILALITKLFGNSKSV